jgi:hypothetical protein
VLWLVGQAPAQKASRQFNGFFVGCQKCAAVSASTQVGFEGNALWLAEFIG